jgi:hypothetical protein
MRGVVEPKAATRIYYQTPQCLYVFVLIRLIVSMLNEIISGEYTSILIVPKFFEDSRRFEEIDQNI